MDLNDVMVFLRIAEDGSFTAAARGLGVPKSTVSRKLAALEERLGARLVERTTRRLRLTEAGTLLLERVRRIAVALDEAQAAVAELQDRPKGTLRLTAPIDIGQGWLAPIIADFVRDFPEVRVDVELNNRVVDLLAEGFDVAIRAGKLVDSSLVARRLASSHMALFAAPSYLAARAAPATPADLADHDLLLFRAPRFATTWTLERGSERVQMEVTSRFSANDFAMLREATAAGLGVGMLPDVSAAAAVRAGRLEQVLPGWTLGEGQVSAVYPSSRHASATLRAFLEHLRGRMTPAPWDLPAEPTRPTPAATTAAGRGRG